MCWPVFADSIKNRWLFKWLVLSIQEFIGGDYESSNTGGRARD